MTETTDRTSTALTWVLITVVLLGVGVSAVVSALGIGAAKLDIVAAARADSAGWWLEGRVLSEGAHSAGTLVWAIATTPSGNRFTPDDTLTDGSGQFKLGPLPLVLSGDSIAEVTIQARRERASGRDTTIVTGTETLRLGTTGGTRWIAVPWVATSALATIFVLSIIVALIQWDAVIFRKAKYYLTVFLAFCLTAAMIAYISVGVRLVNQTATAGEVLSLGFANIHFGTFVNDLQPEWIFSLTAPTRVEPDAATVSGFGVPLWVLLLSVIGAGVYTISLIVKQVADPLSFADKAAVNERVEQVVRHQFYILFAPLGAILVYQLLLVTGAANEHITVALAALASGVSLNIVLDMAFQKVLGLIQTSAPQHPAPAPTSPGE